MQLFWGAQCVHYTQANETDVTRVSIDFRIAPRSIFLDAESSRAEAQTRGPRLVRKLPAVAAPCAAAPCAAAAVRTL